MKRMVLGMAVQLLMQLTLGITLTSSPELTQLLLDSRSRSGCPIAIIPSPMTAFLHLHDTALSVCSQAIVVDIAIHGDSMHVYT